MDITKSMAPDNGMNNSDDTGSSMDTTKKGRNILQSETKIKTEVKETALFFSSNSEINDRGNP